MFIKLQSGKEARLMVAHTTVSTAKGERRATVLKMVLAGRTFKVKSICNPSDNFCKKSGRRYAAAKLLERCREPKVSADLFLADNVTKADRATIFRAICPNYFGGAANKV